MLRKFLYRFGFVPYKDYDELMGRYLRLSAQYIAIKQEATDLAREIQHAEDTPTRREGGVREQG